MNLRRWTWIALTGLVVSLVVLLSPTRGVAQGTAPQGLESNSKLDRLAHLTHVPAEDWRVNRGDLRNGEDPELDDSGWPIERPGFHWDSGTAWFRRTFEIPKSLEGYDLTGATLYFEMQIWSDNCRLTIYVNGSRVAMGDDLEPIVLFRHAQPGEKMQVSVKAASPTGTASTFHDAILSVKSAPGRPDPSFIHDEIAAGRIMLESVAENRDVNLKTIDAAIGAIDTSALNRGDQTAFDQSLRAVQSTLEPLRPVLAKYVIRATGNSHIDMAWLWPWTETVEIVRNTFRTSLQLMDAYPEYTFTQSTAQASEWLEDKYPDIFHAIQQRVKEGRWELVGGMWVEPDLNMPDGESQVRQLLVGKRYFREKFGKDVRIGWNPDSFGYNWQLPQIYKKSGIDYFVTQKLGWNDTNKPTMKLFWWESPDGSRVLTYFPHDYVNEIEPIRMAEDFADARAKVPNLDEMMHLYGIGDHGGGPTRWMLDNARKWEDPAAVYPHLSLGTAQSFFDDIEKQSASLNLPVWNSELYLEYHRGVFTSQSETKKHNRESEELLLNAEKFASLAYLAGDEYPSKPLLEAWKKTLFNQFHDIAAGSGIAAVYKDADRDYDEIRHIGNDALEHALGTLSAFADTTGTGAAVIVFNPLAWGRDDVVEVQVQLPDADPVKALKVTDSTGRSMPVEILASKPDLHIFTIRFLARGVPSLGYRVFHVLAVPAADANPALIVHGMSLENEFVRVKIDPQSGCITSLVDKGSNQEAIATGGCGNLLQAFHDQPKDYDAWNIDADFEKQKWDLMKAEEVKLVDEGPLAATIRVTKKFQHSKFVQDITVYAGVARVDILTDADWHEKHILLKAAFPVSVTNDNATYEIPFGSIERPTTRRDSIEKAKFEVPALRWADLSNAQHGFSLLNDCKYGYDGKDNVLRLSLLRTPAWPDPHADEGHHEFTYSLYPHAGDWKQAQTVRRGYELNYRLIATQVEKHAGPQRPEHSYLQVDASNVVLTAWKKAEADNSLILRLYEWAGKESDVKLRLPTGAQSASEANLMEKTEGNLPLLNGVVTVHTKPYEIKTIQVQFAPPAPPENPISPTAPKPKS
ncbi:MAG: alpha-mannosidase [Candidatus Acidiferrales bacterium]